MSVTFDYNEVVSRATLKQSLMKVHGLKSLMDQPEWLLSEIEGEEVIGFRYEADDGRLVVQIFTLGENSAGMYWAEMDGTLYRSSMVNLRK